MNRYLKIALAVFASLFCLFYAIQNIANLAAAEWFVGASPLAHTRANGGLYRPRAGDSKGPEESRCPMYDGPS